MLILINMFKNSCQNLNSDQNVWELGNVLVFGCYVLIESSYKQTNTLRCLDSCQNFYTHRKINIGKGLTMKVRRLEDDPAFDAGKGSVLTKEGQVNYSTKL